MDNLELAKVRVDRAIKISENYEVLSEADLKNIFHCLNSALEVMPVQKQEAAALYYFLQQLNLMELKRYGAVFKGVSHKNSVLLTKKDVTELVWRVNALFSES